MADKRSHNNSNATDAVAYQRGLAALEQGRFADAIERLTPIARSATVSATLARYYLGQAHTQLGVEKLRGGRHEEAVVQFQKARELNPESSVLSRYMTASYAGLRRFDLAAAEIERDEFSTVTDADRVVRLAHAFSRDGQFERAVETLVSLLDREPYRTDVRVQLGLLYGAAERFEDAVCIMTEAVEQAPFDADVQFRLGLALGAAGDHSEAVDHLAIAQRLRPGDAKIALMLTMAVNAAQATRIKVAIDPVHGRLGVVDDDSLGTLGELIARDPEFVEAFLALPATEMDAEVFTMLAAILERALEMQPDYADLYYHCSRVYERLGRTDDAIARADQAVEINPRYVQALIHLARLYSRGDRSSDAVARLREAVEFGGDYPDVHCLLGELHRREGDTSLARREYRRALELNENYGTARQALAVLESA